MAARNSEKKNMQQWKFPIMTDEKCLDYHHYFRVIFRLFPLFFPLSLSFSIILNQMRNQSDIETITATRWIN